MGFQKILCPVDFSETSRLALERAIELGRANGGTVTLMHVVTATVLQGSMPMGSGAKLSAPENDAADAVSRMNEWRKRLVEADVRNDEPLVVAGDPAAEIVRAVHDTAFDLVVLGTHGKTGVLGALLGNVTYKVVRTASCSVLTVRQAT